MSKIGVKQLMQLVEQAVQANPNRTNPIDRGVCVYTNRRGTSHCIAGQVFEDAGLGAPDVTVLGVIYDIPDKKYRRAFTPAAWNLLDQVQAIFDGNSISLGSYPYTEVVPPSRNPRRWSVAMKLLDEKFHQLPKLH